VETIVHNIRDLNAADRAALERMVGHLLKETQQVVVNVRDIEVEPTASAQHGTTTGDVPDWWKIYEGLSDQEIDELDQAIRQRADLTRHFE
jgi:hypothetical protein